MMMLGQMFDELFFFEQRDQGGGRRRAPAQRRKPPDRHRQPFFQLAMLGKIHFRSPAQGVVAIRQQPAFLNAHVRLQTLAVMIEEPCSLRPAARHKRLLVVGKQCAQRAVLAHQNSKRVGKRHTFRTRDCRPQHRQ